MGQWSGDTVLIHKNHTTDNLHTENNNNNIHPSSPLYVARMAMTPFSQAHWTASQRCRRKLTEDIFRPKSATSPLSLLHYCMPHLPRLQNTNTAYNLRFCFNILYYNSYSDLLMVKPPMRSRYMQHTVQSPPRYYSRPDDGPLIGPKYVVLSINTTPYYISCVRLYYPCTFE